VRRKLPSQGSRNLKPWLFSIESGFSEFELFVLSFQCSFLLLRPVIFGRRKNSGTDLAHGDLRDDLAKTGRTYLCFILIWLGFSPVYAAENGEHDPLSETFSCPAFNLVSGNSGVAFAW
jgi:hypothetical protein